MTTRLTRKAYLYQLKAIFYHYAYLCLYICWPDDAQKATLLSNWDLVPVLKIA